MTSFSFPPKHSLWFVLLEENTSESCHAVGGRGVGDVLKGDFQIEVQTDYFSGFSIVMEVRSLFFF